MTDQARRFPVGLTIAVAISLSILIGLGAWQLQRLAWKEGLLARVEALQATPAQSASAALERMAAGADLDFARISIECPGLASAPYLQL
ncbi:MAG: SURF1 family protein, partial [Caulobacteraceae bacterium]